MVYSVFSVFSVILVYLVYWYYWHYWYWLYYILLPNEKYHKNILTNIILFSHWILIILRIGLIYLMLYCYNNQSNILQWKYFLSKKKLIIFTITLAMSLISRLKSTNYISIVISWCYIVIVDDLLNFIINCTKIIEVCCLLCCDNW